MRYVKRKTFSEKKEISSKNNLMMMVRKTNNYTEGQGADDFVHQKEWG